jgi:hypothetical protein
MHRVCISVVPLFPLLLPATSALLLLLHDC